MMPLTCKLQQLQDISSRWGATSVEVGQFFLAYQSVVVLAYLAFTGTLLELKKEVAAVLHLKPENQGSLWPKTTLATLADGEILSPGEVQIVRDVCTAFDGKLKALTLDQRQMRIDELQVVVFGNRSLEQRIFQLTLPLSGPSAKAGSLPDDHIAFVQDVMHQFDNARLMEYYPLLDPNGRTTDLYYRAPWVECTLIAPVRWSEDIRKLVREFLFELNNRVKAKYRLFAPSSLHLTVRALVPV